MKTQHEGLTETEIATIRDHFAPLSTKTGRAENGARYVIAIGTDEDGALETTTVCRERGRLAVFDTVGRTITEGEVLEAVLAAS